MKKKISINQLEPGMYVASTDRSWLQVPFFRRTIQSTPVIEKLKASGVRSVIIDTSKGKDQKVGSESEPVDLFEHPELLTTALEQSANTHDQVLAGTESMMEKVRRGGKITNEEAEEQVNLLLDQIIEDPQSILCVSVLKGSDEHTFNHCVNSAILALYLGKHMQLKEDGLLLLGKGALLHDIGKCMIPNEILRKPGKLEKEERILVESHVEQGVNYLVRMRNIDQFVITMVEQHHERIDGTGYPRGLKGTKISWFGKVGAMIDVYDTMIHENFYKDSQEPNLVLDELRSQQGVSFDNSAFLALSNCVGKYPPGTILMLDTGEIALVYEPNSLNPERPRVLLLTKNNGDFHNLIMPVLLMETLPNSNEYMRSIVTSMSKEDVNFDPFEIIKRYSLQISDMEWEK